MVFLKPKSYQYNPWVVIRSFGPLVDWPFSFDFGDVNWGCCGHDASSPWATSRESRTDDPPRNSNNGVFSTRLSFRLYYCCCYEFNVICGESPRNSAKPKFASCWAVEVHMLWNGQIECTKELWKNEGLRSSFEWSERGLQQRKENHCSMVSSSALESKSVSFSLLAAKMSAIENKNSNHLAAPCLPPCTMLQLLWWFKGIMFQILAVADP